MKKLLILSMMLTQLISCQPAFGAEVIDVERLATAIRRAEGNDNYGILKHIKEKNFRKACIQTINHRLRTWDGRGDFLSYLSGIYCPVGVKNDPSHLNENWLTNVRRFYATSN